MIRTLLADGPALGFVLSATSLATASARRVRPFSGRGTRTAPIGAAPKWLPWAMVGAMGTASLLFGFFCPELFAAAMNEGFAAP